MLCKECGSQIPDDASVCEFCGAHIRGSSRKRKKDAKSAASSAADAVKMADIPDGATSTFDENELNRQKQLARMMEEKKRQLSEIEKRRDEKRRRQKKRKILIAVLICALAVAAAGLGTYYIMSNVQEGDSVVLQPTATPVVTPTAPVPTPPPSVSPSPSPSPSQSPSSRGSSVRVTGSSNSSGSGGSSKGGSSSGGSSTGGSSYSSGGSSSGGSSYSSSGSSSDGGSSSSSSSSSSSGSGASSSSSDSSSSSGSSARKTTMGGPGSVQPSQASQSSGISSSRISAKIVTGGEVIAYGSTGKYLMTFSMNGKKYYAYVSAGSTTDMIYNKLLTIDAVPTGETYDGNTIYDISSMTYYDGDYILPYSGTRLLTESDIEGMSKYQLALARNEIYARHGRKFQTPEYNAYFSAKSWYKVNPNFDYSDDNLNLNEIEIDNVDFILRAEKR